VTVDYARFGRQIALPEVGPDGQRRLGETPVDLSEWPPEAASLHRRAGGRLDVGDLCVEAPPPEAFDGPSTGPLTFGVGAYGAVEAARRVLGQPPATIPAALLARLRMPGAR